jgi:putative transposase
VQTFYRWRQEYGGLQMDHPKRFKDAEKENGKLKRRSLEKQILNGIAKLLSPKRRRCALEHAREKCEVSEQRACHSVRQWRGTQCYRPPRRTDEDGLTQTILALATKYVVR